MSELLSSRTKELREMSRWKLKVAEGLLRGHTNRRIHIFKLGLNTEAGLPTVGTKQEDSICIDCFYLSLECSRYKTLGCIFLLPKDLEHMRVNGLINLVANTRLGIIP